MKYTGKYRRMYSKDFEEAVSILEYESKDSRFPYCSCDKCGKPIVKHMFVVQSQETDVELAYYGADCIKKLK